MRWVLWAVFLGALAATAGAETTVTVEAGKDIGPVPRTLFGTNLRPNMESKDAVLELLRDTGITVFRYPDARDGGYVWKWPEGVMLRQGRPSISRLGRLDGAVEFARQVGADLTFTVRVQEGATAEEAAEVVRQVKARGITGAYWCLGNEPYFKSSEETYIAPEDYVKLTRRFVPAMKAVDPTARVGIAWAGQYVNRQSDPGRDEKVLAGTADVIDFIDHHFYTGRPQGNEDPWDPMKIVAGGLKVKQDVDYFSEIFRRVAPAHAERIEIHSWEWSGPPWPRCGGMQRLATAVFGADALGEFARNGITLACQYNLQEHHCGLIPGYTKEWEGGYETSPWNGKTVRPLAYAIKLWSRYMGPVLVECSVAGASTYHTEDWHTYVNYQGDVPYLAAHATRSQDGKTLQLMVISRHPTDDLGATIRLRGFRPRAEVTVRPLNGPDLRAHNDYYKEGDWRSWRSVADVPPITCTLSEDRTRLAFIAGAAEATAQYTFPAHSVTQLVFERAE